MKTTKKQVNINDERDVRLAKLHDLQNDGINPYPASSSRTHTVEEALETPEDTTVTIAGRIMFKREFGKLTFCKIKDESGLMQIALKQDELGKNAYAQFIKKIDTADIVQATGTRFVTHKGEQSILVKEWTLLSKAILPLPDKFHGLHDEETRYRKRYLDFLMNPEEKKKIEIRSSLTWHLRKFLHDKGFMEIETPMLETVASGAMAKTFDTHLQAFDLPVHLRICIGELWQKRLLVGGFEKTFEIGRAFRNEGVDRQHNPEFTMIEYYWAYADYEDNIIMHEEMIPYIVENAVGSLNIDIDDHTIDFSPPYPRVTFRDVVLEHSNIDLDSVNTVDELRVAMKDNNYEVDDTLGFGNLMDSLYKQTARPQIIQPTFVMNYPAELKPLAKKANDPKYSEMFQLIVNGFELSNSYSELNDPIDQRERFEVQTANRAAGDEEAMCYDEDYVTALEHAMPPATGTGIGIDRFTALITGAHTLREIITFPLMKPKDNNLEEDE